VLLGQGEGVRDRGQQRIVGVAEDNPVGGGGVDAGVSCGCGTRVRLAHHGESGIGIEFGGRVGAVVDDDDTFHQWERQSGPDGAPQQRAGVVGRDDDIGSRHGGIVGWRGEIGNR